MSRLNHSTRNQDLFESGQAYQSAWLGSDAQGPTFEGGRPPEGYPGEFGGYGAPESQYPVPYQQPPAAPTSNNPLSNLPIKDIKAFVDRMGGIDGIMNTFQKMNGLMKNVQQMAPMLKLLMGSFAGGGAKSQTADYSGRRRRRRRRSSSSRRKTTQNRSRAKKPTNQSRKSSYKRNTNRR